MRFDIQKGEKNNGGEMYNDQPMDFSYLGTIRWQTKHNYNIRTTDYIQCAIEI